MWESAYQNPLGLVPEEKKNTDIQSQIFEENAKKRWDYCINIARIFKSAQGKAVLKVWRENTIESAAWMPSIVPQYGLGGANAHAYAREGQNAFVRDIELCIEIAQKCKTLEDFCAMINQSGTVHKL